MSEFKEKPKMGRPKAKPPSAMRPKQAAQIMKEKYLQQLDQRPEEVDTETNYATDRIEGAGHWATDEAVSHVPRPRQRRKSDPKERHFSEGESDLAEGRTTQEPRQQPNRDTADAPKQRERPRQQSQRSQGAHGPRCEGTHRPGRGPGCSPSRPAARTFPEGPHFRTPGPANRQPQSGNPQAGGASRRGP